MDIVHERQQQGIAATLRGRHILLTGFTGFLGKVWISFLLDRVPSIGKITLLCRGRRDESAQARVRHIFERSPALRPLRERYGDELYTFLKNKIEVVEGDVKEPLCGIDPATLARLTPTLDAVVHCAGLVDFSPDPMNAISVNVDGARHAADVAARTSSRRLIQVSTCFVAGMADGEVKESLTLGRSPNGTRYDVDQELVSLESACEAVNERVGNKRAPAARHGRVEVATQRAQALGWPNIYTYSKGLSEQVLAKREDVEVTFIRPSIVECAHEYPFPGWNEGINTSGPIVWMCTGYMWKVPMRADNCFDIVPVDSVARAMTLIVADAIAGRAERVYQLASGDHARFTFGRALDLAALKIRQGYRLSHLSTMERALLTHMDTTTLEHGADRSVFVPAAQKATKWLRDTLQRFDAERHLPSSIAKAQRKDIKDKVQKASLSLNKTSMLLKSIEALWEAYQPFIHDFDYVFATKNVRARTEELKGDDRERFGWDMIDFDWRHYWMNVQIPGLDKWSLPLLRGKEAPEDEGFSLGAELPLAGRAGLTEMAAVALGGAE